MKINKKTAYFRLATASKMNFLGGIIQLQRVTTNYMSCAVVFGEALLTLRSQIGGTERSGKISYSTISVSRITYEAAWCHVIRLL